MRNASLIIIFLSLVSWGSVAAAGNSDRVAIWNIANFWHVPGEYLRPGQDGGPGQIRTEPDFDAIRALAASLNADVIALQEIASPEAARIAFPEADYDLIFSDRFVTDLAANPDKLKARCCFQRGRPLSQRSQSMGSARPWRSS